MKTLKEQNSSEDEKYGLRSELRVKNLIKTFNKENFTQETRMKKAVRHFWDAIHFRTPRNDIDIKQSKWKENLFLIQTSPAFQLFLFSLGFIFMIFTFFEPTNRYDNMIEISETIQIFEFIILLFFLFDAIILTLHLSWDFDRSNSAKFFRNFKLIFKWIFVILFWLDAFYFYSSFPDDALRFSRYLRPFVILLYSKELRRTFKSVVLSFEEIIQLFLFLFVILLITAYIGTQLIGDMEGIVEYDHYSQNFNELFITFNIFYALLSFDGYPDCMLPAIEYSSYFFIYFLTFLLLQLFIFLPIPVAIVFEGYRNHRCEIVIMDRIKQKEALLYCFASLDINENRFIDYKIFYEFMSEIYYHKRRYQKRIPNLWHKVNYDEDVDEMNIIEFFTLIEQIEKDSKFSPPFCKDLKQWDDFRRFMNRKCMFKKISKSSAFNIFIFTILIINIIIIIVNMTLVDPQTNEILDVIDNCCLGIYIIEFLIKIIGLGIARYFEDSWNVFDFVMILVSIFSSILQSSLAVVKSAKQVKSSKIIKMAKLNRIFRGMRSLKALNFLLEGLKIVIQVKTLIQRVFLCIPMILKLIPVILMIFYLFAVIGLDLFNTVTFEHQPDSPYQEDIDKYANFTSFGHALLVLFQIAVEADWSNFIFDYTYKFGSFAVAMLYFVLFHLIIQLILISLIKGIIWEIFTVVENSTQNANSYIKQDDNSQTQQAEKIDSQILDTYQSQPINSLLTDKEQKSQRLNQYEQFLYQLDEEAIYSSIQDEKSQENFDLNEFQINRTSFIQDISNQLNQKNDQPENLQNQNLQININGGGMAYLVINNNQNFQSQTNTPVCIDNQQIEQNNNRQVQYLNVQQQFNSQKVISYSNESDISKAKSNSAQESERVIPSQEQQQQNKLLLQKPTLKKFQTYNSNISSSSEMTYQVNIQQIIQYFKQKQSIVELIQNRLIPLQKFAFVCTQKDMKQISNFNQTTLNDFLKYIIHTLEDRNLDIYQKIEKENEDDEDIEINQNFVMNQALLKDIDKDILRKIEIEYFQDNYSIFFGDSNKSDIKPLLRHQGLCLDCFHNLIQYSNFNVVEYFKALELIQQNISMLMKYGSVMKIMFKDSFGNWLYFTYDNQDIKPILLNQDIWNTLALIISKKDDIYIARDIFYHLNSFEYDHYLEELFEEMKNCTMGTWDKKINSKNVFIDLYLFHEKQDFIQQNDQVHIKEFIVMISSYIGKDVQSQKKNFERLASGKQNVNLEQLKQLQESQSSKSKLSKDSSLPLHYLIQMIKNIRFLLKTNKENMMIMANSAIKYKRDQIKKSL